MTLELQFEVQFELQFEWQFEMCSVLFCVLSPMTVSFVELHVAPL